MNNHRVNGMCAHASKKIAIKKWGNPNCIQNVVEKIRKINQEIGKINRVIN
jgi:hypothetical protein